MRGASAPDRTPRVLAALCASCLAACGREEPVWFREVALERGLDFVHVRAKTQRYWFPEIMGGGVGLLDYDGDGRLDVYLVQSGDLAQPSPELTNRLYRNGGGAAFTDVTTRCGAADPGYGMGCACGDADGDGDVDLYVTNVGPNFLYRNEGGVFRNVTAESGTGDPGWGTSAAFADLDADGDLDLVAVNYVRWSAELEIDCHSPQGGKDYCSPLNYDAPARAVLYRNEGHGAFTDVSESAGLSAAFGNGLGVVTGDLDGDGRIDIYVANDMLPNQLWINRGDWTFVDQALFAGCAVNRNGSAEAGMGTVAVDVEEDGDLDLFITHLRDETNTLFRNHEGVLSDRTSELGLASPSLPFTGFGVGFGDFDRDGWLDVYVANGAVTRNRRPHDPSDPYAEPNLLFRGRPAPGGAPIFEEVFPRGGTEPPLIGNSRGAAFGDLDDDGDVDVVVVDNGARVELLENVASDGHWIGFRVRERNGADALGARVALASSDRIRYRQVDSAGSYCSSNDPRVHFGLGQAAGPVRATVRWVDRSEESFGPLPIDRLHTLQRGSGTAPSR